MVPLSSNLISVPSYLANDMEEDCETPKENIISFLYRKTRSQIPWFRKRRIQYFPSMRWRARKNRSQKALFHKLRFQFFRSMGFRAWVSLEELEEVGGAWGGGYGEESGGLEAGRGEGRGAVLASPHLLKGCLFFQIQAYDPGHWVWARDRATFPGAPGTMEA